MQVQTIAQNVHNLQNKHLPIISNKWKIQKLEPRIKSRPTIHIIKKKKVCALFVKFTRHNTQAAQCIQTESALMVWFVLLPFYVYANIAPGKLYCENKLHYFCSGKLPQILLTNGKVHKFALSIYLYSCIYRGRFV